MITGIVRSVSNKITTTLNIVTVTNVQKKGLIMTEYMLKPNPSRSAPSVTLRRGLKLTSTAYLVVLRILKITLRLRMTKRTQR